MNIEKATFLETLPQFIRQDSQTLVQFLEHYYDFVNMQGEPSYVIDRIIQEHDLDEVFETEYLDRIKYEIAKGIPESPYVQKTFLLKRIIDYYGTKGNPASVKYFFRVFFGDDVEIYEPWESVFITSAGKWTRDTLINIVLTTGSGSDLINKTLVQYRVDGRIFGSAIVKSVREKIYDGQVYYEAILRDGTITGTFDTEKEIVSTDGTCVGSVLRSFQSINILNKGTGYKVNDIIYIDKKENISFFAVVERIGLNGEIEKIKILDRGISSGFGDTDLILYDFNYYVDESSMVVSGSGITFLNGDWAPSGTYSLRKVYRLGVYRLIWNAGSPPLNWKFQSSSRTYWTSADDVESPDLVTDWYGGTPPEPTVTKQVKPISEYTLLPNDDIIIKTINGTGAELSLNFGTIVTTDGYYENDKGRTSNFSFIHDSNYYQVYSYEVSTTKSMIDWKQAFEELAHPSGTKVFNNLKTTNILNLGLTLSTISEVLQAPYIPEILAAENLKVKSTIGIMDVNDSYFAEDYIIGGYAGETLVYNRLETQGITSSSVDTESN
jgi:hypothetical protein